MSRATAVAGTADPALLLAAADGHLLRVAGPAPLVEELATLWAAFAAPAGADLSGGVTDLTATDRATTAAEINRALVAHLPHPAVHSGVVALPSGAVAFPAVSGAGKSTMTAALCAAGAGYLSDEALVLDDGANPDRPLVTPYPKPLALSPWSAAAVGLPLGALTGDVTPDGDRELLYAPDQLGAAGSAHPLAHLLLPERTGGRPTLEPVHRREGLATLLRMSFNHFEDPRRFLVVAAAAVRGARVHRLLVGDPLETAALVVRELG